MSLLLELSEETQAALAARAEREGVGVPQLATSLLQQGLRALHDGDGDPDGDPQALSKAVDQIRSRTQAERDENRKRILAHARQPHDLPEGKTLTEMVVGKWPGTETDQEISQLLKEIS
jgi:hypothetical protein